MYLNISYLPRTLVYFIPSFQFGFRELPKFKTQNLVIKEQERNCTASLKYKQLIQQKPVTIEALN